MMGWQWHQLDHMQIICTSLHTDNHTSPSPLQFLQADGCPSCRPANSIKAPKAVDIIVYLQQFIETSGKPQKNLGTMPIAVCNDVSCLHLNED